jgi:hypothetical protein
VHLVIVGGLYSIVEAIRELKSALRVNVCIEKLRHVLREAILGSFEKVSKLALFAKNVKGLLHN